MGVTINNESTTTVTALEQTAAYISGVLKLHFIGTKSSPYILLLLKHKHLKLAWSLRPGTEISCAGSNNDLCTVYKNSECCGEAAPETMAHLGNHQCVVSMRQNMLPVHCNKIPQ